MKTRITCVIALLVGITANVWAADKNRPSLVDLPLPERWLPMDDDGWTVVKPAADSQLVYVSSSEGNDETAQVYQPGDDAIGNDPVKPIGAVKPYKTIAKAMEQVRDKMPDWVLLKRGDQWRDVSLAARNGRSESEPFVITAYGDAAARPLIVGRTARISVGGPNSGVSHSVVMSLDLYCSFIDPASPDYGVDERTHDRERNKTHAGMQISTGKRAPMENVLVEDCLFRFCGLNTQNFGGVMRNVVFRRNVVLDRYPVHGHTMGMWGAYATILVEECVFDHNGWLLQNVPENKGKRGLAIPLSHNTYCTGMNGTIFRGNTFLRAASIGNKWTANQGPGSARNIVIDNNLYVDGEIGISMGGNQPGPLRWKNMRITNNVMLDIGKSRPTGRTLGWYVDATDWDGGLIAGNLFLHQRSPDVRNVYAIHVGSSDAKGTYKGKGVHCRNVTIRENVIHGLESSGPMVRIGGGELFKNVVFANNRVQLPGLQQPLVQIDKLSGVKFEGNTYFSDGEASTLFATGTRSEREELSFEDWLQKSGETDARFEKTPFPNPDRSLERYMRSLGNAPTHAAFINAVRKQSKTNWRPELTAPVVNDWFRAGFGAKKVGE
jgi:hypothetical protein